MTGVQDVRHFASIYETRHALLNASTEDEH